MVTLITDERDTLKTLVTQGNHKAEKIFNALILHDCDAGEFQTSRSTNKEIARVLKVAVNHSKVLSVRPCGYWRTKQASSTLLIALFIEEIADQYKDAEKITLVMDNLNTHEPDFFMRLFHGKRQRNCGIVLNLFTPQIRKLVECC